MNMFDSNIDIRHDQLILNSAEYQIKLLIAQTAINWLAALCTATGSMRWLCISDIFHIIHLRVYKWTFASLSTSILLAGDVGVQVGLSFPLSVSGTGAQLLTEVLLNQTQVIWVQGPTEGSITLRFCLWGGGDRQTYLWMCERAGIRVGPHTHEEFTDVCDPPSLNYRGNNTHLLS